MKQFDILKDTIARDSDGMTYVSASGRDYEELANRATDRLLLRFSGLVVDRGGRRSIPSSDVAAGYMQWDARYSVSVATDWTPPPPSPEFYVYGGHNAYLPPPMLKAPRQLSPSKDMPKTSYLAVLEFTQHGDWTKTWTPDTGKTRKSLLVRIEERLRVTLQRAGAAGVELPTTSDDAVKHVVALAGVVGQYECRESVEDLLSKSPSLFPLTAAIFKAHRFVFFRLHAFSPTASIARSGGAGFDFPVNASTGAGPALPDASLTGASSSAHGSIIPDLPVEGGISSAKDLSCVIPETPAGADVSHVSSDAAAMLAGAFAAGTNQLQRCTMAPGGAKAWRPSPLS